MADLVTDLVAQSAFDQVERLKKSLEDALKIFNELVAAKLKLGGLGGFGGGSGSGGGGGGRGSGNGGLDEMAKLQQQILTMKEKLDVAYLKEKETLVQLQAQQAAWTASQKASIAANSVAVGSIDAMNLKMKELEKQIRSTGDAQGQGAVKIKQLTAEYNQLNKQVSAHEQAMGNFKRNVGNYASAYNGMSLAISQVAREMPNFAQSVQIGVMSLTNNIGGLVDGYRGLVEQNRILAAQNQATIPIWRGVTSAILSWNTLIMVGVTLLTAFSKEILDFGSKLFGIGQTVEKFNAGLVVLNKQYESQSIVTAISNMNDLKIAIDDVKKGVVKKSEALKLYNDTMGKTTGYLNDWDEAEKTIMEHGSEYIDFIIKKAAATAAAEESAKKTVEAMKFEADAYKTLKSKLIQEGGTDSEGNATNSLFFYSFGNKDIQSQYEEWSSMFKENDPYEFIKLKVKDIQSESVSLLDIYKQLHGEISKTAESLGWDKQGAASGVGGKNRKEPLRSIGALDGAANEIAKIGVMRAKAEAEWHKQLQETLDDDEKTWLAYLKNEEDAYAAFWNSMIKEAIKSAKELKKQEREAAQKLQDKREGVVDVVVSGAQLASNVTDGIISQINIRSEAELNAIDLREKKELDSLARMKMSEDDRIEKKIQLELKYETQRKKLHRDQISDLRRAALFQRGLDITQIIANTYLAFTKDLVNPIKAAADIVAGTAAVAAVLAQPLPQYAKGTDNHKGGAAIVGEEGTELGILPSGKTFLTKNKATVMNLPAKTKIIPHDKLVQMIYNNAIMKMSEMGGVQTTDGMQAALIASVDGLSSKMEKIEDAILGKDMSLTLVGDAQKYVHLSRQLR